MAVFPSVEWFDAVRAVFNGDDAYQRAGGGSCDANVGIMVGEKVYLLVFEGRECEEAREISEDELEDADFYLDMGHQDWRDMLVNIAENGGADLDNTLNTLDLDLDDGLAQSKNGDQYRQDLFFRYNQTFQYFFDASARIETEFEMSGATPGES